MADGWRNRFMAPVYALVISFVFVFILGAALNETRIRFEIAGASGSSELPEEFWDDPFEVKTTDGKGQLAEGTLNQSGEFTLRTPDEDIWICTALPNHWFAADPKVTVANGVSCWVRPGRGEDGVITLDLRKANP